MAKTKWKSGPAQGQRKSRGSALHLWNVVFFVSGVLVMGSAQLVLPSMRHGGNQAERSSANTRRPDAEARTNLKPWGELEVTPLVLERPEEMFDTTYVPTPAILWYFTNRSHQQVADLIASAGLTDQQKSSLLDTNRWQSATNGWRISPPLDVVKEMRAAAREKIYSVLAESPENVTQFAPFTYRADGFDEWLANCNLSPEKLGLVRQLSYIKRGKLYFADSQLYELLSSSNEVRCLARTLTRVPTLLLRLRITPDSDVDALYEYWGRLDKRRDLKRLLKSMAEVPGGTTLNVSYFMPPVPRLRLYTYPTGTSTNRPDCFWTAFNFFSDQPDDRFWAPEHAQALLHSEFYRVGGQKKFGDLLLLLESGDTALHMCVYVADDIVFTKNGSDPYQPWVLMRMKDMMALYSSNKPQEWRVFRRTGT